MERTRTNPLEGPGQCFKHGPVQNWWHIQWFIMLSSWLLDDILFCSNRKKSWKGQIREGGGGRELGYQGGGGGLVVRNKVEWFWRKFFWHSLCWAKLCKTFQCCILTCRKTLKTAPNLFLNIWFWSLRQGGHVFFDFLKQKIQRNTPKLFYCLNQEPFSPFWENLKYILKNCNFEIHFWPLFFDVSGSFLQIFNQKNIHFWGPCHV